MFCAVVSIEVGSLPTCMCGKCHKLRIGTLHLTHKYWKQLLIEDRGSFEMAVMEKRLLALLSHLIQYCLLNFVWAQKTMLLYFKLKMGNFNGTHVILSVSFVGFVHKIIRTFQEPGHLPEVIKFNRMARDSNSGNWEWMLFGEKKRREWGGQDPCQWLNKCLNFTLSRCFSVWRLSALNLQLGVAIQGIYCHSAWPSGELSSLSCHRWPGRKSHVFLLTMELLWFPSCTFCCLPMYYLRWVHFLRETCGSFLQTENMKRNWKCFVSSERWDCSQS